MSNSKTKSSRFILETLFDDAHQLAAGILYIEEQPSAVPVLLKIEFDDYFEPLNYIPGAIFPCPRSLSPKSPD